MQEILFKKIIFISLITLNMNYINFMRYEIDTFFLKY